MNDATDLLQNILADIPQKNLTASTTLSRNYNGPRSPATSEQAKGIIRAFQRKLPVAIHDNEGRHSTMCKYAVLLRTCGYKDEDITSKLKEHDKKYNVPPKNDDIEIAKIVQWVGKIQPGLQSQEQPETSDPLYDYNAIAETIRDTYRVLSFNKTLYRYTDGFYIEDKGFLDSEITRQLLERGIEMDGRVTVASAQVNHYLTFGRVENDYPFNLHTDAFPVKNGIVKIDFNSGDTSLIPFNPAYRFNYKLAVSYDQSADSTPIHEYLDSLGTDTDILLQIPSHAILGMFGRVYKKEYFLKGEPDSGKSTLLDMFYRRFFGANVCSSISLQSLLNKRFSLAGLDGKILNVYADLGNQRITDIGLFKALSGGDPFEVEKKGKDPYFMVNKALMVFSANKYPKITCGDAAFWDRWISLEFENSFEMNPTFFEDTFTDANMSGLLNLVLKKMQHVIKNGLKTTSNVETKWLNDASSSHRYIQDCLEKSTRALLVKDDLYQQYVIYCHDGDYEPESHRIFTDAMKLHGALSVRPTVGNKRQHCYQGFKLKDYKPIYSDDEDVKKIEQKELEGLSCQT